MSPIKTDPQIAVRLSPQEMTLFERLSTRRNKSKTAFARETIQSVIRRRPVEAEVVVGLSRFAAEELLYLTTLPEVRRLQSKYFAEATRSLDAALKETE